eukprot:3402450-Rhodomonas_salina.1
MSGQQAPTAGGDAGGTENEEGLDVAPIVLKEGRLLKRIVGDKNEYAPRWVVLTKERLGYMLERKDGRFANFVQLHGTLKSTILNLESCSPLVRSASHQSSSPPSPLSTSASASALALALASASALVTNDILDDDILELLQQISSAWKRQQWAQETSSKQEISRYVLRTLSRGSAIPTSSSL